MPVKPTDRVCPSCGEPAGPSIHCGSCGANLVFVPRLPERREWQRSQTADAQPASATPRRLRYSAQDLERLHVGQGGFERGRLRLRLLLDEHLGEHETVQALARGSIDMSTPAMTPHWMIVTSDRILFAPYGSVVLGEQEVKSFDRKEVTDPRARKVWVMSWLSFSVDGKRKRLRLRGRQTARALAEKLEAGSGAQAAGDSRSKRSSAGESTRSR